jgi:predicted O-methyltransferase YrrM
MYHNHKDKTAEGSADAYSLIQITRIGDDLNLMSAQNRSSFANMNTTYTSAATTEQYLDQILELERMSKQGESYSDSHGRYGWRNPVRGDTGPILTKLVRDSDPSRILEIGTGHGLSTLYLAQGLSAQGARIHTLEFDPEVAKSTQERMDRCAAPVEVIWGDANQTIPRLSGSFDLVFFDAQKNQYYNQLMLLIHHGLIGKGAMLVADNVTDRKIECQDFLDWFDQEAIPHEIIETECGLLVAHL